MNGADGTFELIECGAKRARERVGVGNERGSRIAMHEQIYRDLKGG